MSNVINPISCVVLAGGKSQRMQHDKALLPFGSETFLSRTLRTLRPLSSDLILSSNTPAHTPVALQYGAKIVQDEIPNCGPLGGLHAGLCVAQHNVVLVVACDMPFLSAALLQFQADVLIADAAHQFNCAIPRTAQWHPLHAAYRQSCTIEIENMLAQGERKMMHLLSRLSIREVSQSEIHQHDPKELSLMNVNTPEHFVLAQQLLRKFNWYAVLMRPTAITADKINGTLNITWNDHTKSCISFSLLSQLCPCEPCQMERNDPNPLKVLRPHSDELDAVNAVGNYGINIVWKGGCRFGIYTWEFLARVSKMSGSH